MGACMLDPQMSFVLIRLTRAAIAERLRTFLNDNAPEVFDSSNITNDDDRLTDDICSKYCETMGVLIVSGNEMSNENFDIEEFSAHVNALVSMGIDVSSFCHKLDEPVVDSGSCGGGCGCHGGGC